MRRRAPLAIALTVACSLPFAGMALAAGSPNPTLLSPNHKTVAAGKVKLVVGVPLKPDRHGVFITISPTRKLSHGHLRMCTAKRCDFVEGKHWKGHDYRYVSQFHFPGYWAVTPGKYYWQADYFTAGDTAHYYSKIGTFVVR